MSSSQIFFEEFTATPRSFINDITNVLLEIEDVKGETLLQDEADYLTKEMKERNMFANDTSLPKLLKQMEIDFGMPSEDLRQSLELYEDDDGDITLTSVNEFLLAKYREAREADEKKKAKKKAKTPPKAKTPSPPSSPTHGTGIQSPSNSPSSPQSSDDGTVFLSPIADSATTTDDKGKEDEGEESEDDEIEKGADENGDVEEQFEKAPLCFLKHMKLGRNTFKQAYRDAIAVDDYLVIVNEPMEEDFMKDYDEKEIKKDLFICALHHQMKNLTHNSIITISRTSTAKPPSSKTVNYAKLSIESSKLFSATSRTYIRLVGYSKFFSEAFNSTAKVDPDILRKAIAYAREYSYDDENVPTTTKKNFDATMKVVKQIDKGKGTTAKTPSPVKKKKGLFGGWV
jgi:hypothetical protein